MISLKYKIALWSIRKLSDNEIINLSKELKFRKNIIIMKKTLDKFLEKNHPLQYVYDDYSSLNKFFGN
jgi:hypothetical protein